MVITLVIVNSSEPLQFTEGQHGFVFGIVPLPEGRSVQAVAVLYDPVPFSEVVDQAIRVAVRDVGRDHVPCEGVTLLMGARENGSSWIVPLPNRILLDAAGVDRTATSPDAC